MIRDADPYTGVRIAVPARIDRARHPLRIDINVGDPVTPEPVEVSYPALLDKPFGLLGYPLETVLAEKIVTMIDRGDATTRDRDFADVYVLTGRTRSTQSSSPHVGSCDISPAEERVARRRARARSRQAQR